MEKIYDIEYLTSAPEGQHFDRKSAAQKAQNILEDIVAFANAEGGVLAIGIEDDGRITGFKHAKAGDIESFKNIAYQLVNTPVKFNYKEINVTNIKNEEDKVLVLNIQLSIDRVVTTPNDTAYLRQGDKSVKLKHEQRVQLEYDRGQRYFEDEIAEGAELSDLDDELVQSFKEKIGLPDIGTLQVLKGRGLIKNGKITNAGILLFGSNPTEFLPQARLRVIKYNDNSAGVGKEFNVIKEQTFFGPIPEIIIKSREFIKNQLRDFQYLDDNGQFTTMPEYPEFAWFEGIVNAVTHRNYSIRGQHITVVLFDDRLEIKSPGMLPNIVTLENILEERFSRNPKIARVLSEFGWVKEMNEGVKRIYNEMADFFLKQPTYSEPNNANVLLLLENNILNRQVRVNDTLKQRLSPEVFNNLTIDEKKIIRLAYRSAQITTPDVMTEIQKSRPYSLKLLKELTKKGILEWYGSGPRDTTQYYVLKDK
ncbi:ATP-binding protein [Streptococcus respiraculi]|uniref:ATP-binding protein n=1 Tax=Streptococcus respiraculi TaxID=2021971 RepID=UPI000E719D35|nr:ATP-binding protein [Streptococcus respiraculi]